MGRPTQAIIDLTALRHNYALACKLSVGGQALPIVKANAYGHGAEMVAKTLAPMAPAFGVACIEEALALREAGISQPILLLEGAFTPDEVDLAAEQGFWLIAGSQEQVSAITRSNPPAPVRVWLKIDTGMHRLGIAPEQTRALYQQLKQSPAVADEIVLATHFACADDLASDCTEKQLVCFRNAVTGINALHSLANSAGLLGWPTTRADWNRPGYMLYGGSPFNTAHPEGDKLLPVMTLKSAVIALREIPVGEAVGYTAAWRAERPSHIATVAIGYGDGYPRTAANG
ncbi:MAG: alanine racemase, partial [Chromatiales bacterium]|nr:alanine racemase [Chromatiales bacterium]